MKNARNDRGVVLEQLLFFGQLAHAELHLFELIERTNDKKAKNELIREYDRIVSCRIKAMKESDIENVEVLWCFLKHSIMAFIECEEIFSKTKNDKIIELSNEIMSIIDNLISSSNITSSTVKKCPRCHKS